MKVATILGTRPEIIKLSPLLPLLDQRFDQVVIHTGQHYNQNMDAIFFEQLKLSKPKHELHIGSHRIGKQIALMLERIEEILVQESPEIVIVLGDTNTTVAGALAAAHLQIPVMHVESGCRSFNWKMPEEKNRIIADHLSSYLMAPDEKSVLNLQKEGLGKKIFLTGSTIYEAVLRNVQFAPVKKTLNDLGLAPEEFILTTIHRAENTDNPLFLQEIIGALGILAERIPVVFPVHPRTKKVIQEHHLKVHQKIILLDPQPYLSFLALLSQCALVMTDSGGIQEESLVFNTPCLILRKETEWTRLVEAGKNFLAGTAKENIITAATWLLQKENLKRVRDIVYPYTTMASKKIIEVLKNHDSSHC